MRRTLLTVAALAMLATACTAAGAQQAPAERSTATACPLASPLRLDGTASQRDIDCLVVRVAGLEAGSRGILAAVDRLSTDDLTAAVDALTARVAVLEAETATLNARHRIEAMRHIDGDRIGWPLHFRDGRIVRVGPRLVERGENYTSYELREPLAETLTMNLATSNGEILTPSVLTWAAGEIGSKFVYVTLPDGFETTWPTSQRYWPLHIAPTVTLGTDTVRALDHWIRLTRD